MFPIFHPCSLVEREDTRRSYGIAPDDFVLLRVGQPYNGKWNHKIIDVFIDFHKKYPRALLWLVGASLLWYIKLADFQINL